MRWVCCNGFMLLDVILHSHSEVVGDGKALHDMVVGSQRLTPFSTMVLGSMLDSNSGSSNPISKGDGSLR